MTIVCARGFGYAYPGAARPALEDVSFDLPAGSFTVVTGDSASGKSTLLRALCGVVPHFHGGEARGELTVHGLDLRSHGPGDLAAVCGTVLQDAESQVVMSGVRAEIALGLESAGAGPAAVARGVEEAALVLGVAHLLERRTETLSGGELQRVALAAALAHRPQLLVLDEPTAQLDPVAGHELIALLRRLNEDWGTSVVLAEHRLERCLSAADRLLVLERGRLVADGPPRSLLGEPAGGLASPAGRLLSLAGLDDVPVSVKEARAALARSGLLPQPARQPVEEHRPARRRRRGPRPALSARGVWHELRDGPALLRGIDLSLMPGETVALIGRNGAGKSTLLRHLRGLMLPTRGRVERAGEVALLLQSPGDYLIHEHVREEAGAPAVARAGLADGAESHPRDLSGGERQRLALEVVLEGGPHAVVCLDEPTRGMDAAHAEELAVRLGELAGAGAAVVVATHDMEWAARVAGRVVLMGEGVVIADAGAREVLAGGRHFSTEVARVLGGAGGALLPEEGARLLRAGRATSGARAAAAEPGRTASPERAAATAAHPDRTATAELAP